MMKQYNTCNRYGCSNLPESGKKSCSICLEAARKRCSKKRSLGLCIACPKPRKENSTYCLVCYDKRRQYEKKRYERRRANGICGSCATGIALPGISCCDHCWWQQKAVSTLGESSKSNIYALRQLFEDQEGKCALTGETLIPGTNASLDHIIPKSKGGTSAIENLQWVLTSINSGKHDLTQEEFIRLCKLVATKHAT